MSSPSVGGQAVLEGVMMKAPARLCVAVRKSDGKIVVKSDPFRSIASRVKPLGWPFLRGPVVLGETLVQGLKALSFSAQQVLEEEGEELSTWQMALTMIGALAAALGLFVAVPHLFTWWLGQAGPLSFGTDSFWFHAIDGAIKVAMFVAYIWLISLMADIRRVFEYHGAEHKCIYCFEAGAELTVENAIGYPRLHPRCGTAFLLLVLVISILIFAVVLPLLPTMSENKWLQQAWLIGLKMLLMLPIAGISYEVTKKASQKNGQGFWGALLWPGLQLQRLTTREPSPDQVETALAALKAAVECQEGEAAYCRVL